MSSSLATPTGEQSAAIAAQAATVVLSSGAGCGKTAVLTERYLAHLRNGARVADLAAITFTDRAAREMRRRIRAALRAARSADPHTWDAHLRDFEAASISTIHSFCQSILRRHALVAGIDPQFEVLDEVVSSTVREEAVDAALMQLLTRPSAASADLEELIAVFGWFEVRRTIGALLVDADGAAWRNWLRWTNAEIVGIWRELQAVGQSRTIAHLLASEPAIRDCLVLLRSVTGLGPTMAARVQTILEGVDRLPNAADAATLLKEIHAAAKVQGAESPKKWPDPNLYTQVRDALKAFRDHLPAIPSPIDDDALTHRAVEFAKRFLRLTEHCRASYDEVKARRRALDFQDLITRARDLLSAHADILEALQSRIRFVLLDELQDTDPIQAELMELLTAGDATQLFAVGDKKQSIYGFRGADVRQFDRLLDRAPDGARLVLSTNFRSQPGVIRFVNALFQQHIPNYEALQAHRNQVTPETCVEFLWSDSTDLIAHEARTLEAKRIARRIAQMVGRAELLVADGSTQQLRGARWSDVAILFRSMTQVAIYESALRQQQIDYHIIGGRAFFAQQEIYDLLNLLRALENPFDALSLAGTLRSPFIGLSDDGLAVLAGHEGGIWRGLHDPARRERLPADDRSVGERAVRFLDRWRGLKDRLPISRLVHAVLDDAGYDAALQFERFGDRKLANLWKLIDRARTYDRTGRSGLADFIRRLDSAVSAEAREAQAATLPEEANLVRIMTIHQAKGDEFPIVFLPDLATRLGSSKSAKAVWHREFGCVVQAPTDLETPDFSNLPWDAWRQYQQQADWDEELRTFYVACTRAKDFLVLSGSITQPLKAASTAISVLHDRFELQTGECRDTSIPAAERPSVRVVAPESLVAEFVEPAEGRHDPPLTEQDWQSSQRWPDCCAGSEPVRSASWQTPPEQSES